jgi:hypothetical protein
MKMNLKRLIKNILLLFSSILILAGCKKSVDSLPEATQTGANTFGLNLDGKFWIPQKFAGISAPLLSAQLIGANQNDLVITAQNFASEPTETEFKLFIKNIPGAGTYQLNENTDINSMGSSYGYYVKRKINPLNQWITSSQYTGSVTITKWDLPNMIVSGTFEFKAGSIDSSAAPITVTNGRFDIRLQ